MELGVLFLHIGLLLFQPADLVLRVLGLEFEHFHCNATRHSSTATRVEKDQRIMIKMNIFASVPDPDILVWIRIRGSMSLTNGSGSRIGSGSCYFVIDLQDANKKLIFLKSFSAYYLLFKVQKKSQNSRNQDFSYYFCLMAEGSGSGRPKTCGSGGSGSGTLIFAMEYYY
jgi:hypothetical protein